MNKLKVLYITRKYPPMVGGMESLSFNLYEGLSQNSNVEIEKLSLGKKQINLIWFLPFAIIYAIFNASKYDIVFLGDSLLCVIGFFVKLFHKNQIIITNVHGLDVTYQNPIYQFYLKLFFKYIDKYIPDSRAADKILQGRGQFDSTVITPGIDRKIYNETKSDREILYKSWGIEEDDVVLITVGRLVKRKGVEWFVRNVMPLLKDQRVKYLVIGTGENKQNIMEAIAELDLGDQVKLLGRVDDNTLNVLYKNADIFIMPNIRVEGDAEGFGIVAIEASASGLFVVASGIEGIQDAIIDGENGVLVESENAEAFANTIKRLCDSSDSRKKTAEAYCHYTVEHYSWDKICDQYVKLFYDLLDKKRNC